MSEEKRSGDWDVNVYNYFRVQLRGRNQVAVGGELHLYTFLSHVTTLYFNVVVGVLFEFY